MILIYFSYMKGVYFILQIMHHLFQQTTHKKTLYYLEQLILKHNAHQNTTNIKQMHGMLSRVKPILDFHVKSEITKLHVYDPPKW